MAIIYGNLWSQKRDVCINPALLSWSGCDIRGQF